MKTTLEIPDAVFRRAKAKAAEQGIPLRQFVSDAVAAKLRVEPRGHDAAKRKLVGGLRHLSQETRRIQALIEQEFERVDLEEWA